MSRPATFEQRKLFQIEKKISELTNSIDDRLALLECVSLFHSGIKIKDYRRALKTPGNDYEEKVVKALSESIDCVGIPFALAISALAREPIPVEEQKKNGAFYTDFRLANFVAEDCKGMLKRNSKVADFASGTGILLVGIAIIFKEKYPKYFDEWIANNLYAFDLSEYALRGATCAIASMTSNLFAIKDMIKHWKQCDSLIDNSIADMKFDVIVGNPPWGKIKLTRHDFLKQNGEDRIYGASYNNFDNEIFDKHRNEIKNYASVIKHKYDLLGKGEVDMYMAFLQRCIEQLNPKGHLSYIVPAGLIRSKGTSDLREYLLLEGDRIEINLLDNHSSYFSIDSRFKFIVLSLDKKSKKKSMIDTIEFNICSEQDGEVKKGDTISFVIDELRMIRNDLTIPEVNSNDEKELFAKIYRNGKTWGDTCDEWKASIAREIDMTNDSDLFSIKDKKHTVPVVEGRMVQQYRFGAKAYISGSGRSAQWVPNIEGVKAQYYCNKEDLHRISERISTKRAGFCDIAGQTNERAMMCALIPENVVCGNKVPTLIFPNDRTGDLVYLWIGIANSFVFDWMIRRIISTTVNFFLLYSIPMPNIEIESELAEKIIQRVKVLSNMKDEYYHKNKMDEIRAEIEVFVAEAYGLNKSDLELILKDFPLLDRKQACIEGEKKSYVTRDYILAKCEEYYENGCGMYKKRLLKYKRKKARAFIPTEMVSLV